MYKFLSGAKSVKQYRGDENLPEAKNGMKKNCGCKHTRSKYKYQGGTEDLEIDNDPEIIELNKKLKDLEDKYYGRTKEKVTPVVERKPVAKVQDIVQTPVVAKTKVSVPVKKISKPVQEIKAKPVEKKVIRRYARTKTETPVSQDWKKHSGLNAYHKYKDFQTQAEKLSKNLNLSEDIRNSKIFNLNKSQMEYLTSLPQKDREFVENISRTSQMQYERERNKRETEAYKKELETARNKASKKSQEVLSYEKEQEEKENNPSIFDSIKYAFGGKYKYGTGAITVPEGSAIVTANNGKNKLALKYYKEKKWPELEKVIQDMPEDNVDKAQKGTKITKIKGKSVTDPKTKDVYQEESVLGDERYGSELSQADAEKLYGTPESELSTKYKPFTVAQELARRNAVKNKQDTFDFKYKGKTYKGYKGTGYSAGYKTSPGANTQETSTGGGVGNTTGTTNQTPTAIPGTTGGNNNSFAASEKGGNFLANIPSLAEVTAKASILGQGVEGVPENYLALNKKRYVSQLPKALREIQLAEQAGRESARDISGGDAGRYMAQLGALSSARMKAANDFVIKDTLAAQGVADENVNISNEQNKINTDLKNAYANQRAANRGAYNNMLVSLGQSIDTATDAAKLMASQKESDDVRTNLLKTGNYYMDKDGNVHLNKAKKGAKKLKTYKRK